MIYRNVPNRIAEKYSKMTKLEKRIADYFMKQKGSLQFWSITELAEECEVADSTVFRFCKTLGYKGYNDFKLALAKEEGSIMAAQIMYHSERVYCLGQGGSLITAMEAWGRFSTVARQFSTVQDTHMQMITASLLTERDAIWFFSYSGATKDMIEILSLAKERGVKIIVVTRYSKSPATQFADVVLICGSNESPLQSGTIVAKVAQLLVVDMIYQEYIRIDVEKCEENRDTTVKAVSNRLL